MLSIEVSGFHDLDSRFDRLTRVDSRRFNMLLFQYLKKDVVLIFLVKLHFYWLSSLSLNLPSQPNHIRLILIELYFFSSKKHINNI